MAIRRSAGGDGDVYDVGVLRGVVVTALIAVATASAVLGVTARAQASRASTIVRVTEREWSIVAAPARVGPGRVVFRVKNVGRVAHDLVVLRTNLRVAQLLKKGRLRPLEPGRLGQTRVLRPGRSVVLRLTLRRGHYLLICSLVGHARLGMHADFGVG